MQTLEICCLWMVWTLSIAAVDKHHFDHHSQGISTKEGTTNWRGIEVIYHVIDNLWIYQGLVSFVQIYQEIINMFL